MLLTEIGRCTMRSSSEGKELCLVQDAIQGKFEYHSWPEVICACSRRLTFDFLVLLLGTREAKFRAPVSHGQSH